MPPLDINAQNKTKMIILCCWLLPNNFFPRQHWLAVIDAKNVWNQKLSKWGRKRNSVCHCQSIRIISTTPPKKVKNAGSVLDWRLAEFNSRMWWMVITGTNPKFDQFSYFIHLNWVRCKKWSYVARAWPLYAYKPPERFMFVPGYATCGINTRQLVPICRIT